MSRETINSKEKRIAIMVSNKMYDDICDLADMKGLNISEIVRYAVAEYVSNQKLAIRLIGDAMVDTVKDELYKRVNEDIQQGK